MQAVILAAGRGTRMRELCHDCPKPMVRLLGKPLLEWRLQTLPEEIAEVILVVGYLEEQIRAYFGNEWKGRKIQYITQEILNGTGGAMDLIKERVNGPTLVTMGDDLYHPVDLEELMNSHNEGGAILGLHVTEASSFGLLSFDQENRLQSVIERPHGEKEGTVCIGGYVITPSYFDYPKVAISDTEYGLPQTLVTVSKDIPVRVYQATAWQSVGCPEDIPLAEAFIQKYFL